MLATGDIFAGYAIERQLGRGGMGSVYLARHPRLPRQTALKLLNPELFADTEIRARFEREADLAAQLEHPNIVTVYDRGIDDGRLWISMQYVDGVDAATLPHPVAAGLAVHIVEGTAAALDHAHRAGVLHRDVKPANVLLADADGERRVLLADFGIARLRDDVHHLTQTGSFTATLAFAAPEQLTGATLDHRTDQYSLACTLYSLLAGVAPFDADNPAVVIRGHLQAPPPSLHARRPDLPVALDAVLARALAKRPADRFDSCAEFAAAARRALGGTGSQPTVVSGGPAGAYGGGSGAAQPFPSSPPVGVPHEAGRVSPVPPSHAVPSPGAYPHAAHPGAGAQSNAALPGAGAHSHAALPGAGAQSNAARPGLVAHPAHPGAGAQPGIGAGYPYPAHPGTPGTPVPEDAPAPDPRRRTRRLIALAVAAVLALPAAIWAWQDEDTVVAEMLGHTPGHQAMDALHDAFPEMVPSGYDKGTGYDGRRCEGYRDKDTYSEFWTKRFDGFSAKWSCEDKTHDGARYAFFVYPTADMAASVVSRFFAETTENGQSTTGYRVDFLRGRKSAELELYAGSAVVSTFAEAGRERWVLLFYQDSDGPSYPQADQVEPALLAEVASFPLG
ncbi:serine/threonine-protein kinase [Nocardia sp. SSK8]|uniref:serine/threonine-protein kinase n=1 Tax=Nocardia sp. SSK8 TaxID=3120154 RepID=UPI00300B21C5